MSQITSPQYRKAFILVTTLFFMWGLSYGLIDVLNKHFQVTLNVSKAQSGLIQAAYFGAYFVVAIPAGLFMEWKGYKAGILCGLSLYAIGALLFVPAAGVASFTFFLFALFVIALGLGCLETAANSYSSALGSTETAETRLNLSQSFNGLGQFTGPLLGGLLFFGGDEAGGDSSALKTLGELVDAQLAARAEARKNKDFAKADQIRDALAAAGITIEDGPTGSTWTLAPSR